jgi:hypothetical protein
MAREERPKQSRYVEVISLILNQKSLICNLQSNLIYDHLIPAFVGVVRGKRVGSPTNLFDGITCKPYNVFSRKSLLVIRAPSTRNTNKGEGMLRLFR